MGTSGINGWFHFFAGVFVVLISSGCGKSAVVSAPAGEWTVSGSIEIPTSLADSRLARGTCLQVQSGPKNRVVGARECPKDSAVPVAEENILFALETKEESGDFSLELQERKVGLLRQSSEPGKYVLAHLCQFSDPLLTTRGDYRYVCELRFAETDGSLWGLFLPKVADILAAQREDLVHQSDLLARVDRERKELDQKVKRLEGRLHLLRTQSQTAKFFEDMDTKMDVLRTELLLNLDPSTGPEQIQSATPEQIRAAAEMQSNLTRQFAREIAELRKFFDHLPKDAPVDDVLKALKEHRRKIESEKKSTDSSPSGERKEARP